MKEDIKHQSELNSVILFGILDNIIQCVVAFGPDQRLQVWNRHYTAELKIPDTLLKMGTPAFDIFLFLAKEGVYGQGDPRDLADKRLSLYWGDTNSRSEITALNNKTYDVLSHRTEDGSVVLTYTDITAHKQTEKALRDNEKRFQDFAEAGSDWYWEQDDNLSFTYLTEAVKHFNGGEVPEAYNGKTRPELNMQSGVSKETWEQHLSDLNEHHPFKNFEYSCIDSSNVRFDFSISGRPIFDESDKFIGYRGIGQDITERKKMELSLRQHQEFLEVQVIEQRDREERLEAQASELVSVAEDLAMAEEKMKFLANHDALTGLPSLRLCKDRIETTMAVSRREKKRFALMFIDLDGFKAVNDSFGHEGGDQILKDIADRIQLHTREVDTVARIGGDEFIVLFAGLVEQDEVAQLADRLLKALSEPFGLEDGVAKIGASIGIALYPDDGQTVEGLMRRADDAMYKVKQSGKNNYCFASDS